LKAEKPQWHRPLKETDRTGTATEIDKSSDQLTESVGIRPKHVGEGAWRSRNRRWEKCQGNDLSPGVTFVVLGPSKFAIRVAAKSAQHEELMRAILDFGAKSPDLNILRPILSDYPGYLNLRVCQLGSENRMHSHHVKQRLLRSSMSGIERQMIGMLISAIDPMGDWWK
jgi:hypothetical protein